MRVARMKAKQAKTRSNEAIRLGSLEVGDDWQTREAPEQGWPTRDAHQQNDWQPRDVHPTVYNLPVVAPLTLHSDEKKAEEEREMPSTSMLTVPPAYEERLRELHETGRTMEVPLRASSSMYSYKSL